MKRIFLAIAILVCPFLTLGEFGVPPARAPKIVIGVETAYPPYTYHNPNLQPVGINVDVVRALGAVGGLDVELKMEPWNSLLTQLKAGTIDAIAGMSFSAERDEKYDFTPEFASIRHSIFMREGGSAIDSEEELKGRRIIVQRGGIMHDYVRRNGLCADPLLAKTHADALTRLAAGEGDYAIVAQLPGFYYLRELDLENIRTVGPSLRPSQYCIAVREGDSQLLDDLNSGLAVLRHTGRLREIMKDWLDPLKPDDIEMTSHGMVKIGVLANSGRDECLRRWALTAEHLGEAIPEYTFKIVPLGFDEVFDVTEKGQVDFVLANPSIYVQLEMLHGVSRLATVRRAESKRVYSQFAGTVFCRADRTDINSLEDLDGRSFMAVDPNSLGGWHMALYELAQRGIDPGDYFSSLEFGGSHDAVVKAVLKGEVDCGTVRSGTIERMAEQGKIEIRDFRVLKFRSCPRSDNYTLLHSTRHYPEWPIAKLAHTHGELARAVAVALLSMESDSSAARAARYAGWTVPLNYGPVGDLLKELRVGAFRNYGEITLAEFLLRYWYVFAAILAAICALGVFTIHAGRLNRRLQQTAEEREIAQQETRRLALIVRQAIEGVLVVGLDGAIEFANQAWAIMHGYKDPAQLIGKGLEIFYPGEKRDIAAADFVEKVKKMGRNIGEYEHVRADGEVFPATIAAVLMDDQEGSARSIAIFARDITESKEAAVRIRKTLADTERINRLMIGREKRILEMKGEVNALLKEQGRPIKYSSVVASKRNPDSNGGDDG